MRMFWMSALAAVGCGAAIDHTHDYDAMLGELRREAPPRAREVAFGDHLERSALVRAVLDRNPGVEAMRQAWRAAMADVRRAGVLDDPMVTYEVAPLSIAGTTAPFGQRVQVSQKLPWPGKRALEGDAAVADAAIAHEDVRALALELAQVTSDLFDDYVLVEQELALNEHHRMLTEQMRKAAEAQLAAGRGSTQDALSADVELGKLAQERLALETEREGVVAQLDGLLHRAAEAPLPPPAAETVAIAEPAPLDELLRAAAERPDARAASERITGATARAASADRAFYPDFVVMGSYDSMWDMPEHRWMVGVGIDVPLQRGKREAGAEAARARVEQANAELDRLRDDVRVAVVRARREVVESNAVVTSFDQHVLPASRAQVDAALQGFVIGRNDFTAVIAAERNARELDIGAARARIQLSKRRTALARVTGHLPDGGTP